MIDRIRRIAAALAALCLAGCGGTSEPPSYPNAMISISPLPASVPVSGTVTFTWTVSNDGYTPQWFLTSEAGSNEGTAQINGNTLVYTAPPAPPIYNPLVPEIPQGSVYLSACVTATLLTGACASDLFVITAPAVTVGLSPTTASVALGATQQFTGYAVGSVNTALTWQVNGVTGGSVTAGTISAQGLYTAPAILPMSGSTVTVTMISQADPTKTATAVITLT